MAIAEVKALGLDTWLGSALSLPLIGDVAPLRALIARGLDEITALHVAYGVK